MGCFSRKSTNQQTKSSGNTDSEISIKPQTPFKVLTYTILFAWNGNGISVFKGKVTCNAEGAMVAFKASVLSPPTPKFPHPHVRALGRYPSPEGLELVGSPTHTFLEDLN